MADEENKSILGTTTRNMHISMKMQNVSKLALNGIKIYKKKKITVKGYWECHNDPNMAWSNLR